MEIDVIDRCDVVEKLVELNEACRKAYIPDTRPRRQRVSGAMPVHSRVVESARHWPDSPELLRKRVAPFSMQTASFDFVNLTASR